MQIKPIYTFLFVLVFYACKAEKAPTKIYGSEKNDESFEQEPITYDTIHSIYGQSYVDSIPKSMDTTFLIDGKRHTLRLEAELHGNDTISYDEEPYLRGEKVHAVRYYGRDVKYTFSLLDSSNHLLWEKTLFKSDYLNDLGSIVTQSNMWLPGFKTYLSSTNQLILIQVFSVPDSDVGVEGILFFDIDGQYRMDFHKWYLSGESECEVIYSADSSWLLTCSEIISPNGKSTSIKNKKATIAGNLFIGKDHAFVSYVFDDASALGGRLYNKNGKIVKEIKFDGYSGALGYELPFVYSEKHRRYYFVDEPNKCFLIIPEETPAALKTIPFSKVRRIPENETQDIFIIRTEVSDHQFGIDESGEIRAHQSKIYGEEWKFFDEVDF